MQLYPRNNMKFPTRTVVQIDSTWTRTGHMHSRSFCCKLPFFRRANLIFWEIRNRKQNEKHNKKLKLFIKKKKSGQEPVNNPRAKHGFTTSWENCILHLERVEIRNRIGLGDLWPLNNYENKKVYLLVWIRASDCTTDWLLRNIRRRNSCPLFPSTSSIRNSPDRFEKPLIRVSLWPTSVPIVK